MTIRNVGGILGTQLSSVSKDSSGLFSLDEQYNFKIQTRWDVNYVFQGLLLNLDAGSLNSYPGSGTTWFDLSGNNNGTLVNGPTYDSANFGSLVWASNRVCTVSMTNLRPTQITQECWFKLSSNSVQVFIGAQYGSSTNNTYALWLENTNSLAAGVNIAGTFNWQNQSFTLTTGIWYHFVHTYDGTNQNMYMNGVSVKTWATTGAIAYDSNNTLLAVGNDWSSGYNGGASSGVLGNLGIVRLYNRSLSASEVQQNFNFLRSRYGI